MKSFQTINEAAYLTAPNAERYRLIMRLFYREYEKMHFQLDQEGMLTLLKNYTGNQNYPPDQLKADLESLVAWKNLVTIQEVRHVHSIAEYKNRQFRYSMSEPAVEIERLTVKLENLFLESGSLSTNLFARLNQALEQAPRLSRRPVKELSEWGHNLQDDLKRLNQNYQDYLREFYSGKGEKLLKSFEFIQHKDLFVTYLTAFVQELKDNENLITASLYQVSPLIENQLLDLVVQSELEIPHAASEKQEYREENLRENIFGKWQSFKNWFLPAAGHLSECERVMEITNEVIRQIIQNAALLVQFQNWGLSRKSEYQKLLELFLACPDLEEAHKLGAHAFGIQQVRHYRVNGERGTDSINSSPYEEKPAGYPLKPWVRTYKPRLDKSGFLDRGADKLKQKAEHLAQLEEERRLMKGFIRGNRLDLGDLQETLPAVVCETLLRWISLAYTTSSRSGITEYGQSFTLTDTGRRCVLKTENGQLELPEYVFNFEEQNYAGAE